MVAIKLSRVGEVCLDGVVGAEGGIWLIDAARVLLVRGLGCFLRLWVTLLRQLRTGESGVRASLGEGAALPGGKGKQRGACVWEAAKL